MKKLLLTVTAVGVLIILSIKVPIPIGPLSKFFIAPLEERTGAKVEYGSLKIYLRGTLTATKVHITGKGGFALGIEDLLIRCKPLSLMTGRLHIECELRNIKFYEPSTILNSITGLLRIGPLKNQKFNTVRADLFVGRKDTITQDLTLLSDNMKVFGNAVTDIDNNLMAVVSLYLHDSIAGEIPIEIRSSLLRKEEGPWSSISIGIIGNYREPRLRILAERFRMNISNKAK